MCEEWWDERLLKEQAEKLTRQWIEGRRIAFISPLRMYLMASLVYFGVAAIVPSLRSGNSGGPQVALITTTDGKSSAPDRVAERTTTALTGGQPPRSCPTPRASRAPTHTLRNDSRREPKS